MKPNILLFFVDDQRFDTIQALGNKNIHTPHLDKFCSDGTVFTHAHIPGGTSGAVCMPSRAMLHTGRTLFHLQGEGQNIPNDHVTLGECFQGAGYQTFGSGKWHNGRDAYARSFTDGDQIFFGGMEDHWNVPVYHYDPSGRYQKRTPFVRDPFYSNELEWRDCDHIESGTHSTEMFVDAAIDFLDRRDLNQPFFLYVSLMAPHDPRTMPEGFRSMYNPDEIELPANFLHQHPHDTGALRVRDELLAEIPRQPEEIRRHIAEYFAMISHLDDAFGRLLEHLDQQRLTDNTIVIFAGDNGLAVGQHGLMGKQNLYDHSLRVPLIFRGPGVFPGGRCDSLAYLLDIFPTLCDLIEVERPPSVDGESLLDCLESPDHTHRKTLYLAYCHSIRGISNGRYKLIEYICGVTQLFDLESDPLERHNLAQDPQFSELLADLRQQLCALRDEWDDLEHPMGVEFWHTRADLQYP